MSVAPLYWIINTVECSTSGDCHCLTPHSFLLSSYQRIIRLQNEKNKLNQMHKGPVKYSLGIKLNILLLFFCFCNSSVSSVVFSRMIPKLFPIVLILTRRKK